MRKFFLIAIVVIAAGYTGLWYHLKGKFEQNFEIRLAELGAQGYEITYKKMKLKGFPFSITAVLKDPTISQKDIFKVWIDGDLIFKTAFWHPQKIKSRIQAITYLNVDLTATETLQFKSPGFALDLYTFDPSRFEITLDQIAIMDNLAPLAQVQDISLKTRKSTAEFKASSSPEKIFDLMLSIKNLSGPILSGNPFAADIKVIELQAALRGAGEGKTIVNKLQSWYQADGTLDITRLMIQWGPLHLNAEGTLSLDEELQPLAAFSTEINGLDNALDMLVEANIIKRKNANMAKMALVFLAESPEDPTLPGTHRASISIQDGKVDFGPITLLKLPKFKWQ